MKLLLESDEERVPKADKEKEVHLEEGGICLKL